MRTSFEIEFKPVVVNDKSEQLSDIFVRNNIEAIANWYSDRLDKEYQEDLGFEIEHIQFSNEMIYVKFTLDSEISNFNFFQNEFIYDPDEDMNYPMIISGTRYYVYYKPSTSAMVLHNNYEDVNSEDVNSVSDQLTNSKVNKSKVYMVREHAELWIY